MATVHAATVDDMDRLIELQCALFREDAAVHDPFVDLDWPSRGSRDDLARLGSDPNAIVLVARRDGVAVGYLAAYSTPASATRKPVTYAILRSLYVQADQRGTGAAGLLVKHFLVWARERGCAQVRVDCYAGNHIAQRFYERLGLGVESVTRVLDL